jgi:membrane protease YdiL (CAAX protease family)
MRSRRSGVVTRGLPEGLLVRLAIGAAAGLALVGVVVAGAAISGRPLVPGLLRPAAPFLSWAAITIVVASAEELLLRGRAFDAIGRAGGTLAAVLITTVVFALMHVPLYGWQVVPLDLAVGLGFAGLRLATRGVAAPAAAHTVADLATWWL